MLNKSKNIVFSRQSPSCLVFAFDWLQASISSLAISLRYQAAACPLAYARKSKNIVFSRQSPSCLVFAFDWLQASISSLAISLRYQAAACPLAYASSIVLDNSFRKHCTIIFQ